MKRVMAVAALLLLAAGALAGCFHDKPAEKPPLSLSWVDTTHTVTPGNSTTFIGLLRSRDNQTVDVSATGLPAGWSVEFNRQRLSISKGGLGTVFMVVRSYSATKPGDYSISLSAKSIEGGTASASGSVKVKVKEPLGGEPVKAGWTIRTDYTGYLTSYIIFDTSLKAVGNDREIPKTPDFRPHPDFTPLEFAVGQKQMIPGYDEAVLGMRVGESKTVVVPPKKGYGQFETRTVNLTESVPIYQKIPRANFTNDFREEPVLNKAVRDPFWNWSVLVVEVKEDTVTIMHTATVNQTLPAYGWPSVVAAVDPAYNNGEGRILVQHSPPSSGNITYRNYHGSILALNDTAVTFEYNTSVHPLGSETLVFEIKVASIVKKGY